MIEIKDKELKELLKEEGEWISKIEGKK